MEDQERINFITQQSIYRLTTAVNRVNDFYSTRFIFLVIWNLILTAIIVLKVIL